MTLFGNGSARGPNKRDYAFDESQFKDGQRKAAAMLVEKEFSPKNERLTNEQIADEIGISRSTLYLWDKRDRNFIEYKNYLAADFMDSYLPFVYSKLLAGIDNGSMRGIELYLKRSGELNNKSEVTVNQGTGGDVDIEDRKKALLDRLGKSASSDDRLLVDGGNAIEEEDDEDENKSFSKDG